MKRPKKTQPAGGDRTINQWYNLGMVVNPSPGQFGNAGKGVVIGSGNNRWDLVISKYFPITERHQVEFRGELFNAFNHPQFDDPVVAPANNPTAGKVTSASDYGYAETERVIQFGLRYHF
jgi:hypothetical protein